MKKIEPFANTPKPPYYAVIFTSIKIEKDEESIQKWKANIEHQEAQKLGKEVWYSSYKIRVAKIERDYEF